MRNKKTIANLLTKLSVVFRDFELNNDVAYLYYEALKDIEEEKLISAVNEQIKRGKSFPLPAELIEMC